MNRNQKLVLWVGGILVALSVAAAMYLSAGIIAVLSGVAWKYLDTSGRKPENVVIRSVHCGNCGAVGEPHWAKCPKCGAANWK